jgi:Protein of unknown function (DUF3108)
MCLLQDYGEKGFVGMLRLGLIFAVAVIAAEAKAADVISASYDVSLGGTRVMKADYSATLDGDSYSADLSARTVGVSKMFSKIKLNMSANGSLTETGVKPVAYAYSRKKNDKRKERNLSFSPNGTLVTEEGDYDASIMAALNNKVMDPLSMLLKLGRSDQPCAGKHRAFDGRDVFDVTLSGTGKAGATLTCKMVYKPVAGNDVEDGDTEAKTYEITLAPLNGKDIYVPVRLSGSTSGVGFEASATSVTLNGTPLSY